MKYWTSVIKNISIFFLTLGLIFLLFKMAIYYIPFLIGFIISLLIEPLIKKIAKKTGMTRKTSAILVLVIIFTILIGSVFWGIITLITESSDLLESVNLYIEKTYNIFHKFILNIKINETNLPNKIIEIIQNSLSEILKQITKYLSLFLNNLLQKVTLIPIALIYIIITILSTYFLCADKFYILDQLEHHIPRLWVKRFGKHVKEISIILGNYLKVEAILILISFFIILIGLTIGKFIGLNIKYPLLCALGIAFVDALPILRGWNYNDSMGNNIMD